MSLKLSLSWRFFHSYRLCKPSEKHIYKSDPLFGQLHTVKQTGILQVGDVVYKISRWLNGSGSQILSLKEANEYEAEGGKEKIFVISTITAKSLGRFTLTKALL